MNFSVEIYKVYKIKLENDYKHDALVLFKGSYKECSELKIYRI